MFISTRDYHGIYELIVRASKKNCESLVKKNLEILIFRKKKFPSFKFLFFFINIILSGKIFKNNRSQISFEKIEIGRFVISNTLINFETYVNKLKFYVLLIKNFYFAGTIIKSCDYYYYKYNISGAYIDHCGYLNGIIFSFFAQKKVAVYTNNYPHGIYFVDYKKNKKKYLFKYENSLKINFKKKLNFFQKKKASSKLENLVKQKNFIPWLAKVKFSKPKNLNYQNFDYIIYTHSFTDGQMWYGNDGFENTLEWFEFTLNAFVKTKKKILIKPHPNFYNRSFAKHAIWDRKLYDIIVKKYQSFDNFYFLKNPIHNYKLLKKLNKNCIAISKFGSVILEAAYMNFRSISSINTFYNKKFKISNMYEDREGYLKLLKTNYWKLDLPDKDNLYELIYSLFYIYYSCYNEKNYYENIIMKKLKLTKKSYKNLFFTQVGSINLIKKYYLRKLFLLKKYDASTIKKLSQKIWQVKE
jgi:hypothetical protein